MARTFVTPRPSQKHIEKMLHKAKKVEQLHIDVLNEGDDIFEEEKTSVKKKKKISKKKHVIHHSKSRDKFMTELKSKKFVR